MYTETLQELGLAKNEARIYETLLKEGELPVGQIANISGVHRRNVYDSLNRLVEKGLVFEILESKENRYQAVDPQKLVEIQKEKESALMGVIPELEKLYRGLPRHEAAYIYRGVEGYKNYMRDILRIGKDVHVIGAKGAWADPELKSFSKQIVEQTGRKNIKFHLLIDAEVRKQKNEILSMLAKKDNYRFLPKEYSTGCTMDIFGDRIVQISGVKVGEFRKDVSFTVIVNQQLADAFRIWFKALWKISKK